MYVLLRLSSLPSSPRTLGFPPRAPPAQPWWPRAECGPAGPTRGAASAGAGRVRGWRAAFWEDPRPGGPAQAQCGGGAPYELSEQLGCQGFPGHAVHRALL